MRALVLGGAGAMGRWTIRDLTESDGVDAVVVADLDGARARETAGWAAAQAGSNGTAQVQGVALDAADGPALRRAFEAVDVVCNCAVHATNLRVMAACADSGTHYVDLGGLFHTTRRQLALHDRFVEAGATAVVGMGGSPGTTNVMAALAARGLDTVEAVEVRLGSVDLAPRVAPLPVPYAIQTLLDEFSVPAMAFRDGAFVEVPAMSEQEELDFPPPVGRVRVGHTLHSEVATLPLYLADRGIRSVTFKVGFAADFMDRMALLAGLGLAATDPVELPGGPVVPRDLLVRCIQETAARPGPDSAPDDAEAIWVRVRGRRAVRSGEPALAPQTPVEVLAECVVVPDPAWRAGAGELDTGVPASVVAQFLGHKLIDRPGVFAPEDAVPPEPYFAELARRHMEVAIVTRQPAAAG
ncbi:MAG TPA: saccharopine dehydrogenase NADP-binding domain-containing protein [Actinomycetes bacterium]|nr:saccharopine dehydrogenase NADP-binding domain-containing protein [Actinomycetes bacterium]